MCVCVCVCVCVGIHCEGPFLSPQKKGAHREEFIQHTLSQQDLLQCYGSLEDISIVTLAPELPGAEDTIRWLCEHHIVTSLGEDM